MRTVVMTAVGGPEMLKLAELPEPEISGDHDVKVRLRVPAEFEGECQRPGLL